MIIKPRTINAVLRLVFGLACRVDAKDVQKIPLDGPLILVGNHITFLEVPVAMAHLDNPRVTALAKKISWNNLLFRFLFNQWGIIPIDLTGLDREAFRRSSEALGQGMILAIFPEGTRSHGHMLRGKPGVTALAFRSQAPIIPVGFYGYEDFWNNLKHLRRTDFHMVVGEPFRLNLEGIALSRDVRQEITDEIMYKVAELVPERYRGYYHEVNSVSYRYAVSA